MKKQNSAATVTATACLVFIVFFFMFQCNLYITSKLNLSHSTRVHQGKEELAPKSTNRMDQIFPLPPQSPQIRCDRSHHNYDLCEITVPTILDSATSTFFLLDSSTSTLPSTVEKIRPYPRKWEKFVMTRIKELTITSGPEIPVCKVKHNVPALVFSVGGYTGNFWHEFNDGFIPLFITVNSIFPDQDFVLVISKASDWWVNKYADLLQTFSKYPIVKLDDDNTTHCFTSATLGLISHGFVTIDPALMPNSKTFLHFRAFLEKSYSNGRNHPTLKRNSLVARPRLVVPSRKDSLGRAILNQDEVKRIAEEVGFDVIVFTPTAKTPLQEAYALINSSHAMVGVHGAALTHSLFLRPGSVFVQVVPLGLEWVAEVCFAKSAWAMGLNYMEYKINAEESTLIEKYDKNELVIKDPGAYRGNNWTEAIMNIYLKEQNVNFDLVRFREYMKEVHKRAKQFMEMEG